MNASRAALLCRSRPTTICRGKCAGARPRFVACPARGDREPAAAAWALRPGFPIVPITMPPTKARTSMTTVCFIDDSYDWAHPLSNCMDINRLGLLSRCECHGVMAVTIRYVLYKCYIV